MVGTTLGPQNLTEVRSSSTDVISLTNTEICKICFYFVIVVTGVIGNGLVIFVTGYKMKTTVNSIWFLNLGIADFIFISVLTLRIVSNFYKKVWPLGNLMCKLAHFLTRLNIFASVFFLTVISLDRCLCTWLVVWAKNKRTLVKARIISGFVWLLSISCSIPYVIIYSVQERNGLKLCLPLTSMNVFMSLTIFMFMVGFLIPFLIILSSYIAIGVRVKQLKSKNQLRPFRVIISVILAFFICWLPFHVQELCIITTSTNNWILKNAEISKMIVTSLAYLNSCLNPILYVFMCEEFKQKIKRSLLLVLETAFTEQHIGSR